MSNSSKRQLILHIPHSSASIPDMAGYKLNFINLFKEMDILTDRYTDELFQSEEDVTIQANFSRIFCDVERFEDDNKEIMAKYGMGVLYNHTDDGRQMRVVERNLERRIMNRYYKPHHKSLTKSVDRQLKTFGEARIIDCHSFSNTPRNRDLNKALPRPDICIGTDSFHTPKSWINASLEFFRSRGFALYVNNPYSGSMVPMKYFNKDINVKSIMIEVNRKLYMNEKTHKKNSRFIHIKRLIHDFLYMIRELPKDYELPSRSRTVFDRYCEERMRLSYINYITNKTWRYKKYRHIRFKTIGPNYLVSKLQDESLDWVDQETFEMVEDNRVPLFVSIWRQIYPKFKTEFIKAENIISVIDFNPRLYSGYGRLSFYKIPRHIKPEEYNCRFFDIITKGCEKLDTI